ncbi:MAG: hypothetical protein NC923_07485 [Candidatus Omnitrophica bacterium]|nr:hypothetical protein [Candidatus Omnitrophota bacterium]
MKFNKFIFLISVSVIGLSGIVAQVMLLRELLISLYGNELTIGIILANWIISEAIGAILIGKLIERIRDKINLFILLQLIFSLILPVAIYFCRIFKLFLAVPHGEGLGISTIFYTSFLIIFLPAFCHGGLFASLCKLSASGAGEKELSLGKIYSWETVGSIIGGILFTYIFARHFNSFQVATLIAIANFAVCLYFFNRDKVILKYATILAVVIMGCYLYSGGIINRLHWFSLRQQWKKYNLVDYRNSVYGNIAVTKENGQNTFFYNGLPIITTPYPDITFTQEFGNLALLFHENPKDILIIGAGAGGLINEAIKHPLNKIDYAELDHLLIRMLKEHPSSLTASEFSDKRLRVIPLDGRFFVRTTRNKYDAIIIGISHPSELSTNRFFTKEFFSLLKEIINPKGIIAFWLPGSSTYLSRELKDLNGSIINAVKAVYPYLRVISGDYNIVMASIDSAIDNTNAALISKRLIERGIKADILTPGYLDYRLSGERISWFKRAMQDATKKINQDLAPFAVFEMLLIWSKQFSNRFVDILIFLKSLQFKHILIVVLMIHMVLLLIFLLRRSSLRLGVSYAVLSTGFYGMSANLILIFSFQVFYGCLYYNLGIMMSIFMAGIAFGSIYITRRVGKIKDPVRSLVRVEIFTLVSAAILAFILSGVAFLRSSAYLIFIFLFFIAGLPVGLEFPLAGKIYLRGKENAGEVSGLLYFVDLLGGWLAGILTSIALIPLIGIFNTCMSLALLKVSSLSMLLQTSAKKRDWSIVLPP